LTVVLLAKVFSFLSAEAVRVGFVCDLKQNVGYANFVVAVTVLNGTCGIECSFLKNEIEFRK
jgi:hypothetical protein